MRNRKYVVMVQVAYIKMEFEFPEIGDACNFMQMFLDHNCTKDETDVYLTCVDIETDDEKEESEDK